MEKAKVVKRLEDEHRFLRDSIKGITKEQLVSTPVFDDWTIKDIFAHISAWNWEMTKSIDWVLAKKSPWFNGVEESDFNRKEIKKRKKWGWKRVFDEWEDSFKRQIGCIKELSDSEWKFDSGLSWTNGTPITTQSLFEYEYEGVEHEGGHAKQIWRWRKRRNI